MVIRLLFLHTDKQVVVKLTRKKCFLLFMFFRMAGVEEKLGQEIYIADETEGIIPRGV